VFEQVIHKWHMRAPRLPLFPATPIGYFSQAGRNLTRQDIQRDVKRMFSPNFEQWSGQRASA
jgi:hypothetical protein